MKLLIKYLILFIVAAVFTEAQDRSDVSSDNHTFQCNLVETAEVTTFLSETDSDFCVPRQISSASTARVQGNTRRTDNVQRQNVEFVKSGKIIKSSVRYLVQKKSEALYSSPSDSGLKLARLGKLII